MFNTFLQLHVYINKSIKIMFVEEDTATFPQFLSFIQDGKTTNTLFLIAK